MTQAAVLRTVWSYQRQRPGARDFSGLHSLGKCCGPEALVPAGPARDAGLRQAVAAAGKGVARTGPDKGSCLVPAWVSGCLCQPDSWGRRQEGQGQLSELFPVGSGCGVMRPHPG